MLNFNDLSIEVSNQYATTSSERLLADDDLLANTLLDYTQIKEMTLVKDYGSHMTEILLELENLTVDQVQLIAAGSATFRVSITSGNSLRKDAAHESSNYFVIDDIIYHPTEEDSRGAPGGLVLMRASVRLLSWTLIRMLHENNLAFLNWGASQVDSTMMAPKDYLEQKIQLDLMETYGANDTVSTGTTNTSSTNSATAGASVNTESILEILSYSNDKSLETKSTPPSGYRLSGNNNFETLVEFFKFYPPFLSPFGWYLDDMPHKSLVPSKLVVTNFYSTTGWKDSTLMTEMLTQPDPKSINALRYFELKYIQSIPYYNNVKFNIGNEQPILQLIPSSVQVPVVVDASTVNKTVSIKSATKSAMVERTIQNPNIKRIYSFLNQDDVVGQLAYANKYKIQSPSFDQYSLTNIAYKDFDMQEAIKIPQGTRPEDKTRIPRVGIGYKFTYKFTRESNPDALSSIWDAFNKEKDDVETKGYTLSVIANYLMTNDHEDAPEYIKIDQSVLDSLNANFTETAIPGSVGYGSYDYGSTGSGVSKYYGELKISGTPGDIAKTAEQLINTGFKYVWGGDGKYNVFDCSGFTMTAVCTATGLKRWGGPKSPDAFPKKSSTQYEWCRKFAQPIANDEAQAGDIIFKAHTGKPVHHVGIIASPTSVYASSSSGRSRASTCTLSNPCKGAVTQPRDPAKKTTYWDRGVKGIFRIEGHGELARDKPGVGVGTFCEQIAKIESCCLGGGRPEGYLASNPSGARGAYQFMPGTASDMAKKLGLSIEEVWTNDGQDAMCDEYESQIITSLTNNGIPVTLKNVYLSWQQGPSGARQILAAYESGTEVTSAGVIRGMKHNMHGTPYTGVKSYMASFDKFLGDKKVDVNAIA